MLLPRGIRNNNPGNLRRDPKTAWAGESARGADDAFVVFTEPVFGLRALMRTLLVYHLRHGLDTVRSVINRYAPPHENATDAYMAAVSKSLGVRRDDPLDLRDRKTMIALAQAIVRHENGKCENGPGNWYDDALYGRAADMVLNI